MISTCVPGVHEHKFYPMLVLEVHRYVEYLSCMVKLQSADLTLHLVAVWMPVHWCRLFLYSLAPVCMIVKQLLNPWIMLLGVWSAFLDFNWKDLNKKLRLLPCVITLSLIVELFGGPWHHNTYNFSLERFYCLIFTTTWSPHILSWQAWITWSTVTSEAKRQKWARSHDWVAYIHMG